MAEEIGTMGTAAEGEGALGDARLPRGEWAGLIGGVACARAGDILGLEGLLVGLGDFGGSMDSFLMSTKEDSDCWLLGGSGCETAVETKFVGE